MPTSTMVEAAGTSAERQRPARHTDFDRSNGTGLVVNAYVILPFRKSNFWPRDADIYGLTMRTIDGQERRLSDYQGIVNVASRCGLTPQYEGLQKLHTEYAARGFAVLGFPCNQFAGQEPGSEADVKTFCTTN